MHIDEWNWIKVEGRKNIEREQNVPMWSLWKKHWPIIQMKYVLWHNKFVSQRSRTKSENGHTVTVTVTSEKSYISHSLFRRNRYSGSRYTFKLNHLNLSVAQMKELSVFTSFSAGISCVCCRHGMCVCVQRTYPCFICLALVYRRSTFYFALHSSFH